MHVSFFDLTRFVFVIIPMPYGDSWHYVYQQTSVLNYVGPLKLKFAFVWRFLDTNKKGGER